MLPACARHALLHFWAASLTSPVLLWQGLASAYDAGDLGGVQAEGGRLLALLDDMEELLASNRRASAFHVLIWVVRATFSAVARTLQAVQLYAAFDAPIHTFPSSLDSTGSACVDGTAQGQAMLVITVRLPCTARDLKPEHARMLAHRGFLLGPWVAAARALASSEAEAAQNEWNLRTQAMKPTFGTIPGCKRDM